MVADRNMLWWWRIGVAIGADQAGSCGGVMPLGRSCYNGGVS